MYDSAAGRSESGHHKTTSSRHCEHDRKRGDESQPPVAVEWAKDHLFLIPPPMSFPSPRDEGSSQARSPSHPPCVVKVLAGSLDSSARLLEKPFVSSSFLPLHTSASEYVSSTTNIAPGPW